MHYTTKQTVINAMNGRSSLNRSCQGLKATDWKPFSGNVQVKFAREQRTEFQHQGAVITARFV
ncbi:MAG: hypothetical protein CVU89_15735 [Firmicutes bacterium HGW-Firmicutes-14]|nr:MAG: hypothetical protein CVU89_15735 [Firmicutes bacterium HGW-Firmicutes-14]